MLNLMSNMFPVYYKLFLGEQEIIDKNGNATGTFLPIYSELKSAMLGVSANKGSSEVEQYGTDISYDRVMTTVDTGIDIDEHTVLWLDGANTEGPWNYEVITRSNWKNSVQFAIRSVDVSVYATYRTALERLAAASGSTGSGGGTSV